MIRGSNIIVVDDNLDNLRLLTRILERAGYEVRPTLSGKIALQSVASNPPDLILLDIAMPEVDGLEVCRRLKSQEDTRHIPIIFISAVNDLQVKLEAFRAGCADYVTKPFAEAEVLARVNAHLRLRQVENLKHEIELQKQHEDSLSYERNLLQSVMNGAKNSHLVFLDRDFNFVMVNETYAASCGYRPAEMIGKNHFALYPHAENEEIFRRVRDTGETAEFHDKPFVFPDQPERGVTYWDWTLSPVTDAAGQVAGLVFSLVETTERKRAEAELHFQAEIMRNMSEGVVVTRAHDGRIAFTNPKFDEMFGYGRGELTGRNITIVNAPDEKTPEEMKSMILQALAKDGTWQGEIRNARKNGACFWCHANVSTFDSLEYGKVFIGVHTDITERKQAEARLAHSHALMSHVIEHNRSAVAVHDRNLRYIYVSKRYLEDFKISDKDVIGRHHYDVFPDLPQKWRDVHQQVLAGAVMRADEDTYEKADGSVVWTSWECRPWYEADGSVGGIIVYTEVIDERKRSELELKNLTHRLRVATSSARLGVWDWDIKNNIVVCDDRMLELYGFSREAFSGDVAVWESCLHPEDRERVMAECKAAIEGGICFDTEFRVCLPDGATRHIKANGMALLGADGTAERMIGVNEDITATILAENERVKLENQLHQAQKMESIGRLAGGIAHDFNNMLGVIRGHAELILMDLEPSHPLYASMMEIRSASERSSNLTRQLLAFARKQNVIPRSLNLNETVANMLNMLRRLIGENIKLSWLPCDDIWPVMIDPSQVDQILANLCVNARDAIFDVGNITITTTTVAVNDSVSLDVGCPPGEYVLLEVNDDGSGMDSETADRIFEPFFTTKEAGKGTGLGLATVYGAVKQNNGFIFVSSKPGQGTVFSIYLPRYAGGEAQERKQGKVTSIMGGRETILVVEDELKLLKMTSLILEKLGYTVLSASDPNDALRLARKHSSEISLLVTDVIMPHMNGKELADHILSFRPDMKVIFMSGYTGDIISQHGVQKEGKPYIQKPFMAEELASKVRLTLSAV